MTNLESSAQAQPGGAWQAGDLTDPTVKVTVGVMQMMTVRGTPWFLCVSLVMALAACGPKPRPVPGPVTNVPPPPPPGDVFRLSAKVGDSGQGKVTVRVESDQPGPKGKRVRVVRTYIMLEQHSITAVDADGTQQVSARLLDVEGKSENPKEQRELDALSRALSEVKIGFKRTPLGEVTDLTADPINKPLDPSTAQIVARSIYGAGRGVLFAEERQQVGQTWKKLSEVPLPNNAGSNKLDVDYHYDKKEGTVATVTFTGKSTGQAGEMKLSGELTGTLLLDLKTGSFVSQLMDTKSVRGEGTPGAATISVHVEWQAQAPEAPAQAAAPPAK